MVAKHLCGSKPLRAPMSIGHHRFSPSTSTGVVFEARCPMTQKFEVGQTVLPAHPRGANPGSYVIVQVLPTISHERQYRIKSLSSATECVVGEAQIKAMETEPSLQ